MVQSMWQGHETISVGGQVMGQGHGSRSQEAELRFGGLAVASFSTPLGQVGLLVFIHFNLTVHS